MAVSVTFYRCPKTLNSTRVPAAAEAALTCDCNIRDGSGILQPVLELVLPQNSSTIASVNMAYIAMFSRYYWIDEIKYINRKWVVSMHVDVLSTYKTEIGAASRFIFRSASEFDPTIIDDLTIRKCLQKTAVTLGTTGLISPSNISLGVFIVGVVGRDTAPGMVTYYALTIEQMNTFRAYLLSLTEGDTAEDWEDFGGVTEGGIEGFSAGMIKSFIDPFQYVVSCIWFPIPNFTGGTSSTIKFGFWDSGITASVLGTDVIRTFTQTLTTPTRDDESTTMPGMYCKAEPFSELELYYPPFESVKIPASQAAFSGIRTVLIIDLVTGSGILQVYAGSGDNLVSQSTALIGVPFQIAQITTDYMGAANSVSDVLRGAYSLGATWGGMISKSLGIRSIYNGDAAGILQASLTTGKISGTSGGFAPLAVGMIAKLYLRYTDVTEPDIVNVGRPLCKVRTINTLSGYVQCQAGRILCAGTEEELNEIESYMEGGFYYD